MKLAEQLAVSYTGLASQTIELFYELFLCFIRCTVLVLQCEENTAGFDATTRN